MIELPQSGVSEGARASTGGAMAFSFGDPEPVLNRRDVLDLVQCYSNGRWYEPPLPLDGLARAFRVSPHHSSAILLKRNLLVSSFEPVARGRSDATPILSRAAFGKAVLDYLVFGTGYLQQISNVLGATMRLDHCMSKYTRRGLLDGQFFWVPARFGNLGSVVDATEFAPDSIVQIMQPDINQELYGLPEYLSALQSALLNEAATLFRRRYYLNGSHAGYILYATGEIDEVDTDALKEALRGAKGPGNFRNLFVHAPNGKEGSIKIMPIAEAGAKDEFLGIKNATRDDVLASHRVPPALLGIVPAQGSSGFGNPLQATQMFFELEIAPIQAAWLEVNDQLGMEAVRFTPRPATPAA